MTRPREPVYKGRPLSVWLEDYDFSPVVGVTHEADDAVRHIGTNAIPALLRLLRRSDPPPWKRELLDLADKLDLIKSQHVSAWALNWRAASAFKVLGSEGRDGVPALIEIYNQNVSEWSRVYTVIALGGIGPAAKQAVPSLLQGMNSTDYPLHFACMRVLGQIHAEPTLVVPVLAKSLQDSDAKHRVTVAQALGNFGAEAKVVAPVLLQLLTDPDSSVRDAATNALKAIDPEAAAKAGVK
jgi:HEAT repeat protein